MNADYILKYYWDIFISHTSEFYPFDESFIKKYEYELDWSSISKNRVIKWDFDFLKKYETRFLWNELAWNENILWTEDKIDHFKKRLDWYYLGRNKNLPITEGFIQKYAKDLFVIESNPLLSNMLIKKHSIRLLPVNSHNTQEIKSIRESEVKAILDQFGFHHNQKVVYNSIFLPIINENGIEHLFSRKFDYAQRYYFLEPVYSDVKGLTPEFQIDGYNPFNDFTDDRDLIDTKDELTLINGPLQEGPDRLYEIPRFSSFSFFATLLVSENVKSVLDQFKLPRHIYHSVKLKQKRLATSTKYFILQIEHDTLVKDLKFSTQAYFYTFKESQTRGFGVVNGRISNYQDYLNSKESTDRKHPGLSYGTTIYPNCFELNSDYDMYSYSSHGKIIINQYLKDALDKYFPGQMEFTSAQLLNIKIDQDGYDAKSKQTINTRLTSKVRYEESAEFRYYLMKAERLEKEDPAFDKGILPEIDKFTRIESELNVVFPEIFKNNYLRKVLKTGAYKLLPISRFYIEDQYFTRYPETFKSIVIGENGNGDSLNLILERDSDYKLQNRLFEFFHETGEYEEM